MATFDNLNLSERTVDITYVYGGFASSLVGIIGGRSVPDPMPVEVFVPQPSVESTITKFFIRLT